MKQILFFLTVLLILATEGPCFAFQCQLPPVADSFARFTHIFSGRVTEFHSPDRFPFSPKNESFYGKGADCALTVKVDHSFRGKVPQEVTIRESSKSDLCASVPIGENYIFFTNLREDGSLTRTQCDPTTSWSWETACALARLSGQSKGKKCRFVEQRGMRDGYCAGTRLRLDGLVADAKVGVRCIISGDIYSAGDRVGEDKIIKVDMKGVTVECNGKLIGLTVSDHEIPPNQWIERPAAR